MISSELIQTGNHLQNVTAMFSDFASIKWADIFSC